MENGLPALMIAAILMLATVLISRGGFFGADRIGQTLRETESRYGQQNRTGLTVTGATVDGTGANIIVTVRNDGSTDVADYEGMDVLVQYFGETGTRYDKWIDYTSGSLASDTWTTGAFTSDVFEPAILNSGESVEITVRVNPVVGAGTTNRAIIGTDKGVTVSTYFAGP
jgi:archaellum component FlaF (FlaF/FlaG flagellin family)